MDASFRKRLADLGVNFGVPDKIKTHTNHTSHLRLSDFIHFEEVSNVFGSACLVNKFIKQPYTHGRIPLMCDKPIGWLAKLQNLPDIEETSLHRVIYLDIETTSLSNASGTLPFLIGLCRVAENQVTTIQLFMRSPAEEKSALVELIRLVEQADAIVTYNGASFDLEILRSRLQLHKLPNPFDRNKHLDLLHVTRKLWKNTLPSRSLGYLEMSLLGVARSEIETTGSQIPQLYYDFLRTGDPSLLPGILYHNEVDIISLAALLIYILGPNSQQPTFSVIHEVDEQSRKNIDCVLNGSPASCGPSKKTSVKKYPLLQKEIQNLLTQVGNHIKLYNYAQAEEILNDLHTKALASHMAPFSRKRLENTIQSKLAEIEKQKNQSQ